MQFNHLMRSFTIRMRMIGAIGVVLFLLALVGSAGLFGMYRIAAINEAFAQNTVAEASELSDLRAAIGELRTREKDMIISYEKPELVAKHFAAWKQTFEGAQQIIDKMLAGEEDVDNAVLRRLKPELDTYAQKLTPVARQLEAGAYDTATVANRMLVQAHKSSDAAAAMLGEIRDALQKEADEAHASASSAVSSTVLLFGAALLLAVAVVLPLTLLNMQSICQPIDQARRLAEAIAKGDLTGDVTADGKDETAALLRSLEAMQQRLRSIVGDIRDAASNIQLASSEVATGNQDLSQRTEHTASNLQQAASSMEQLTGTVRQTADAATTANQLAGSASDTAGKGGAVVSQVVSTMDEIHTSSQKIADIIGTIDGIAFQTNILALNAAVEAARAGEQGRGFAVVAGEVRSLAQRSAEAAKEIKTLIGASVERVETGSRLVRDAGTTMGEIVASVQRVTDIIGEITAASGEQSQGIAQVNRSVIELDQMTQQNAALVEQSAAAAESLKEQAARLTGLTASFTLAGHAASPAAPVRAPVPAPAAAPARAAIQHASRSSRQVASKFVATVKKAAARPQPTPAKPEAAVRPKEMHAPAPIARAPAAAPAAPGEGDWETF
ncbi:methyl-accepting chemotaxis protein [Aquincola sp. MAHUQ-54]|uniref:Methyl-accepting chemotaxis protein n=1 Tax=Aquincola agrisoli TaxID=3119538 RepID=A0AAW9Q7M7_9BURK